MRAPLACVACLLSAAAVSAWAVARVERRPADGPEAPAIRELVWAVDAVAEAAALARGGEAEWGGRRLCVTGTVTGRGNGWVTLDGTLPAELLSVANLPEGRPATVVGWVTYPDGRPVFHVQVAIGTGDRVEVRPGQGVNADLRGGTRRSPGGAARPAAPGRAVAARGPTPGRGSR